MTLTPAMAIKADPKPYSGIQGHFLPCSPYLQLVASVLQGCLSQCLPSTPNLLFLHGHPPGIGNTSSASTFQSPDRPSQQGLKPGLHSLVFPRLRGRVTLPQQHTALNSLRAVGSSSQLPRQQWALRGWPSSVQWTFPMPVHNSTLSWGQ